MVAVTRRKVLVAGLVGAGAWLAGATPIRSRAASTKAGALSYHDLWRKLWEDHITWTRVVIIVILDGRPAAETNAYVVRLLRNPPDMAAALQPFYGSAAAVLGSLITDHLVIAKQILDTAHAGGDIGALVEQWYANAHAIAVQMSAMNPRFWPLAETEQMWVDHLDATLEEAVDHLAGNYAGEVAAYDKVHVLALEMADFFSDGVMSQFPQFFRGRP
jgi:hypothetical protein